MNALLLPGNSQRHAEWVMALKDSLVPKCDKVVAQKYRHWKIGKQWADVEYELDVAEREAAQLTPYVIVAKSIGTVIAVKGVSEQRLRPEKLVLLGVPINGGANPEVFRVWLEMITIPVVIVQNSDDPYGSFAAIQRAFQQANDWISFVEQPEDATHDYLDFELVARLALS